MPFDATKSSKAACETLTARDEILDKNIFPSSAISASLAIHDLGYLQKIVSNDDNFSLQTKCDIFEVNEAGLGVWKLGLGDEDLLNYLQSDAKAAARYIFFDLEQDCSGTFDSTVSISQSSRQEIMRRLKVNPQFITFLLGLYAVNHIPPTGLDVLDNEGNLVAIDFICQQPRWGFRERIPPISTMASVHISTGTITCITTASARDPRLNTVRSRLTAAFTGEHILPSSLNNAESPFMLPCLITHECFMASDYRIVELAATLFRAVDTIDESGESKGTFARDNWKNLTITLHRVSQDADFLISSVEIGIMMMDAMYQTQAQLAIYSKQRYKAKQQEDALIFLKRALESRRRWLYNSKSKKDTAMNLVYNIVSQQDTEANITIARDTKNDSSSMKTIAVLTMVFLPASTMASFFGMCFFEDGKEGFSVDPNVWLFPALAIPTTLIVLLVWWLCHGVDSSQFMAAIKTRLRTVDKRKARVVKKVQDMV